MTVSSARTGPGATCQRLGSPSSTSTPWPAQQRDRHLDVRHRRHGLAVVEDVDALVVPGAREEERRDELRGRRRVDHDLSARHGAATAHGERQRAPAVVVDRHAEAAQRGEHLADRAGAHVRVAVEGDRPARQGRDRRHEPQHRPGQPAVDRGVAVERARRHRPVVAGGVDPGAEGGQRGRHQRRVPRPQGTAYDAGAVGDRGQHQGTVGEGLAAGQRHRRVDRAAGARRRPRVATYVVTRRSLMPLGARAFLLRVVDRQHVDRRGDDPVADGHVQRVPHVRLRALDHGQPDLAEPSGCRSGW